LTVKVFAVVTLLPQKGFVTLLVVEQKRLRQTLLKNFAPKKN
jgi:hypothetical protein